MNKLVVLFLLYLFVFYSCKKDDDLSLDKNTKNLVETLKEDLYPLSENPESWDDSELFFLDQLADKSVVGLGEATHGTSEFFKAKHRILKYLVENHNFKVFAIEADFGESVYINEAVLNGDADKIEQLMKDKMIFWTWKTEEVKDMLIWMCNYNKDKELKDKVHYMGFDCQYNSFNPLLINEYFKSCNTKFQPAVEGLLNDIQTYSDNYFNDFDQESFNDFLEQIDALKDSMLVYQGDFIQKSSSYSFHLYLHMVDVMHQVSEVRYYSQKTGSSINYRDKYMAENILWLFNNYDFGKVVLWAHNQHISNSVNWMGHHLKWELGEQYSIIGFLFSRGSFRAVEKSGDEYLGLKKLSITDEPKKGSINALMSYTEQPAFFIKVSNLIQKPDWKDAFENGLEYFQMGAGYNNNPLDYYTGFKSTYYDNIIYFDNTTAAVPL